MTPKGSATRLCILLALVLSTGLAGYACSNAAPTGELSTARFSLSEDLMGGVERVQVSVNGPEGLLTSLEILPPFEAETVIELPAGRARQVVLQAAIGSVPAWQGISAAVEVVDGQLVDLEVVVDPVGRLVVEPIGLQPGDVEAVIAIPRVAPPADLPEQYVLDGDGEHFEAALPVGVYDIQFQFNGELDMVPGAPPEAEVQQAVETRWHEPFAPREVPPAPPGLAVSVEIAVVGGRLLAGLVPLAADVQLRLRDAEGRIATGYTGDVSFASTGGLLGLLVAASVPPTRTFTAADQGEHLYQGGLLAPISLIAGLLRLQVDAAADANIGLPLVQSIDIPVVTRLL
jgi:hypothetical protein